MKKLIFAILAIGMIAVAPAQTDMKTSLTSTVTLDTVTNVESEYLFLEVPSAKYLSIMVTATKISGTPNAKVTWEVSNDGVTYVQLSSADSGHVSNVSGAQGFIYTLTNGCPYRYYRAVVTGRGTAAIQIKAKLVARKE